MMGGCIEHNQKGTKFGYGNGCYLGKRMSLHRAVYGKHHALTLTDMPDVVRHKCDNPRCINPAHLEAGTQAANVADMHTRGRAPDFKGEHNPHAKLTDAQVAEIRRRYVPRCPINGGSALAREFGTHQTNVSLIVRGETRASTGGRL